MENFKKTLRADPELWGSAIFGSKMVHLPLTIIFWGKSLMLFSSTYWTISLCKILKNSYNRPRVMRMCHFWTQQWVHLPNERFWENLLINLVLIIHAYLQSKKVRHQCINKILTIKDYWNLIGRESFVVVTWEPDFFQACSFAECYRTIRTFVLYQSQTKLMTWFFQKVEKALFFGSFNHLFS